MIASSSINNGFVSTTIFFHQSLLSLSLSPSSSSSSSSSLSFVIDRDLRVLEYYFRRNKKHSVCQYVHFFSLQLYKDKFLTIDVL